MSPAPVSTPTDGRPVRISLKAATNRAMSPDVVSSVAHSNSASLSVGSSGSASASTSPARKPRSMSRRWTVRRVGDAHRELVEVRPGMEPLHADRREGVGELGRARRTGRRDVTQPVRADRGEVDRGGQREQGLVGADVAGGLVAPDVLLARAKRHDEGSLAVEVGGHARPADPGSGGPARRSTRGCPDTDRRTAARCRAAGPRPRRYRRHRRRAAPGRRATPAR